MKIYHISLNEYKHYAASSKFFTDFESVEKWVKDEIERYAGWITIKDQTVYELIEEYNQNEKYGIILDECEIPNLILKS